VVDEEIPVRGRGRARQVFGASTAMEPRDTEPSTPAARSREFEEVSEGALSDATRTIEFPEREARILTDSEFRSSESRRPESRRSEGGRSGSRFSESRQGSRGSRSRGFGSRDSGRDSSSRDSSFRDSPSASLAGTISVRLRDTSLLCFRANRSRSTEIALEPLFRR